MVVCQLAFAVAPPGRLRAAALVASADARHRVVAARAARMAAARAASAASQTPRSAPCRLDRLEGVLRAGRRVAAGRAAAAARSPAGSRESAAAAPATASARACRPLVVLLVVLLAGSPLAADHRCLPTPSPARLAQLARASCSSLEARRRGSPAGRRPRCRGRARAAARARSRAGAASRDCAPPRRPPAARPRSRRGTVRGRSVVERSVMQTVAHRRAAAALPRASASKSRRWRRRSQEAAPCAAAGVSGAFGGRDRPTGPRAKPRDGRGRGRGGA